MSDLPAELNAGLNIAIALAEGLPDGKVTPRLIGEAIRLCGYKVVPIGAGDIERDAVDQASGVPRIKPPPTPEKWPKQCARCNRIRNDRKHADECDDTACPL